MKKIILLAGLIIATSLSALAQSVTFGIKGGVNVAQLHTSFTGSSSSVSTGYLTTFSAGGFANIQFENFSVLPGLNFTGRGAKEIENNLHVTANLYYLQLPVDVVYNVDIEPGVIYFGAGPYVAYGLSAKVKVSDSTSTQSQNVGFGSSQDKYKPIDAGANIVAGIRLDNGLLFSLNYDYGITNISNVTGSKTTNRVFGASIGYSFK